MLARIGWYLLFLVVVIFYLALVAFINKRQAPLSKSAMGRFIATQFNILAGLIPIVLIPAILTGFFSRGFLLLVFVAFEFSSIFTIVSNHFFRFTPTESSSRVKLWMAELLGIASQPDPDQIKQLTFADIIRKLRRMLVFLVLLIVFMLALVAYFVIASYHYFANPVHSDIAVRKILTLNLSLYVAGALIAAISNMAQISSPQLSDTARRALFLQQAVYGLQMGVILTVYLSLIGIGAERFLPHSLVLPTQYIHYVPFVVLTAFYLIILIGPYLAGLQGRRRAQIALNQTIIKQIDTVIEAVGIPSQRDLEQLTQLRTEFEQETDAWIESEPMVRDVALKIERAGPATDQLGKNILDLIEPYREFRDKDTRFVRFTWTEKTKAKLNEMIEEYTRYATHRNRTDMFIKLGSAYERFFRDEKHDYQARLKEIEARRIVTPVLARLAGVLGAVPVVLQYGQKLIGLLPKH